MVLFGSRARGDAREDSDYDVAVFLKGLANRWQEVDRITSDSVIPFAYSAAAASGVSSVLMNSIR